MEKRFQKKSLQGLLPERETPDFFFLTAHEHDESWRCVHVDVREIGEVRDNCGFAYAGQGQIMNLSQISGHDAGTHIQQPWVLSVWSTCKQLAKGCEVTDLFTLVAFSC